MTNTRIAIMCIAVIIMCRFGNSLASNSALLHLPHDIKSHILRYSMTDSDLLHYYFVSYHKMNETQTKEMNKVIHSRVNNLTFDQSLSLSVFLKTQSLDEDAKRLEKQAMQRTQKLKEEQLNHIICHQTIVRKSNAAYVRISFSFRLQQIFKHLRGLNININGSISLQQLYHGPLHEIHWLELDQNGIHSLDLFSDLTECNALVVLDLHNNELSDINALSELKVPQLHTLLLSRNKLTNIEALRGFNKLPRLYLSGNKIKDIESLAELKALEVLYLKNNNISNIDPLRALTQLNSLFLNNNCISDIGALQSLNKLKDLWLFNNKISDIEALSNLTNLSGNLDLSNNRIKDIEPLRQLRKVSQFCLHNNSITNITLFGMANIRY